MKAALLLAALAATFAASGCGGTSSSPTGGATFVPAGIAAYVAIDTDPGSSQWRSADRLSRRFPGRAKAVSGLVGSVRSESGLDYARDVRPALGPELDLVWLDLANNGEDVVGVLQPADAAAFERAVRKGNASDPRNKLLYERVGGWTVISDDRAKIASFKRARAVGGPVLAEDDSFRRAMGDYSDEALVRGFVSGAQVMDRVRRSVPPDQTKTVDQLGALDWIGTALRASEDGVRLETTVRGRPGKLFGSSGGGGFKLSLPKELPDDVLAYVGFHGTGGMFSALEKNPALASPDMGPVRSMLGGLGRLLEGENALYLRSAKGKLPEVTLVAQPDGGTDGAATLDRILGNAKLGDDVVPAHVAGVDARRLGLGNGPSLVYANVGGKLVVTDLPEGIAGVMHPGSSLDRSTSFRDAVGGSGMPDNVQSFLYVDIRGGLGLAEKLAGAPIPSSVKRNLGPLRSAVEYAASRPSEVRLTLFVQIR